MQESADEKGRGIDGVHRREIGGRARDTRSPEREVSYLH